MQISMKKVIFGNLPTKICTVYRVLLESVDLEPGYVTDKSSYSGQKLTWRDHLWARTQSGEALKVLLSASPLRTIGGQHRFHYKNNLPGLEGQWSAGSGAYSVTDCCSASSRRWQDKEILFILTNFFVDREGAWSFLLLKLELPLSSAGLLCEGNPSWSESETNLSKWWHEHEPHSLCRGPVTRCWTNSGPRSWAVMC